MVSYIRIQAISVYHVNNKRILNLLQIKLPHNIVEYFLGMKREVPHLEWQILYIPGCRRNNGVRGHLAIQDPILIEMMSCMWEQQRIQRNLCKRIMEYLYTVSPCLMAVFVYYIKEYVWENSIFKMVVAHFYLK